MSIYKGTQLIASGGSGGTSDFDELINRPSYNGTVMTHSTNIPLVKTSTWDGKQNAITGAATTITSSNLTANRALISNASGKVAVSAVTSTELGYLDGVTSAIQTQLNGKATTSDITTAISTHNSSASAHSDIRTAVAGKSTVSVSATGTATDEVKYITIDGVQKKLAGGSAGGYHPDLFDHKWADHQLNDISWLRADTFSWQSGLVYQAAYQHLVDEVNEIGSSIDILIPTQGSSFTFMRYEDGDITGYYAWKYTNQIAYTNTLSLSVGDVAYLSISPVKTSEITAINNHLQTETIAGTTIHFYLADDGHKICPASEESNVSTIYNTTGVAWYYILDTANTRFKLPRTQFGFVGLRDTVGKYVPESLPNITGTFSGSKTAAGGRSGAFYQVGNYSGAYPSGTGTTGVMEGFNANLSSPIYKNGATVQERATQMYLYFYVGQFTQSAIEQTAGLNTELFNGKADLNLTNAVSNASVVTKETIVGWAIPDYSAGVTVSSGFTAPTSGFVALSSNTGYVLVSINGRNITGGYFTSYDRGGGGILPINKNDVISFTNAVPVAYFYPCKQ